METPDWQDDDTYAESLLGITLPEGWYVERKLDLADLSGGYNSVAYVVTRGNERGFLKAFDFQAVLEKARDQLGTAPQEQNIDPAEEIRKLTEAFTSERDLMRDCRQMRRVINYLDSNNTFFVKPDDLLSFVPYIVCELAESDLRHCLMRIGPSEVVWRLQTLHHVATGLMELHTGDVSHHDVKLANLLETARGRIIGDLGSASRRGLVHNNGAKYPGDIRYAPPEVVYGYTNPDWSSHHFPIDLFALGSVAVHMFTQLSMCKLLMEKNLATAHRAPLYGGSWTGTFYDVAPYLAESFSKSLAEVERQLPPPEDGRLDYRGDLMAFITHLCSPLPEQRGFKFANGKRDLSLQRVVSKIDLMTRRATVRRKIHVT